ncbi:MAG TPA: tetratricopeptide repeat protein [Bryobacteraceae bacterium]|nr:tetratricopeptide repeat protein [Bryobacteraceae bacterium]
MGSKFCSRLALVALLGSGLLTGAESAEALFQRAASALSSQDYAAAEQGFLAVLKLEPRNPGALGNLGVIYSRTHRYLQAIDVYKRALRIAPSDTGLLTNLGLVYVRQEQFAPALPIFQKLAADPRNLQARELFATCLIGAGKYATARGVLELLSVAEPDNPGVLYMLGMALERLRQTEEAHAVWSRMMAAASPVQANMLMGKASYETEQFEEAAKYYRKALEYDPKLPDAHRELGKTLISLRDNEAAEKELRQTDPEDAEALYFLGGLLAQANRPDAVPVLEKAHQLSPDFWGPLYYLGRIQLDQGRVKEALANLERAAKLKPDEAALQYQLGRAYQKAGRAAEAKAAFDRVKQIKAASLQKEVDTLSPGK